jgi:predicted nucleotidyltransferase
MDAQNLPDVERIISLSSKWLKCQDDVLGIALVGSSARGAAKPGSDIDFVIVCTAGLQNRRDLAQAIALG